MVQGGAARFVWTFIIANSGKEPNLTTWLPRWTILLVLALPFFSVVAAAPDDAEIARLIMQRP